MKPLTIGIEVFLNDTLFDSYAIKGSERGICMFPGISLEFDELYVSVVAAVFENRVTEFVEYE